MDFSISGLFRTILESLFVGFGVLVPIVALIKTSNLKALQVKELFILQAVQSIRIAGIVYFIIQLPDALRAWKLFSGGENAIVQVAGGPFHGYFGLLLIYTALMYLVLTQAFWFKKIYIKKTALIVMSVLLLVLPSQLLFFLLTGSSGQEFKAGLWGSYLGSLVIKGVLNIVVFFFVVFILMQLSGKVKKVAQS